MSDQLPQQRAELRLRGLVPPELHDRQQQVIGQLEELADRGVLETYDIDIWGSEAVLEDAEDPINRRLREWYEELKKWADEHDRSLEPGFCRREQGSLVDGESREAISFPLFSLVVYNDAGIEAVYPHQDGDRVYTLWEGLERLREGSEREGDG
jgi:hypothetical protein